MREKEMQLDDRLKRLDSCKESVIGLEHSWRPEAEKARKRELLLKPLEGTNPVKLASVLRTSGESVGGVLRFQVCGSLL